MQNLDLLAHKPVQYRKALLPHIIVSETRQKKNHVNDKKFFIIYVVNCIVVSAPYGSCKVISIVELLKGEDTRSLVLSFSCRVCHFDLTRSNEVSLKNKIIRGVWH